MRKYFLHVSWRWNVLTEDFGDAASAHLTNVIRCQVAHFDGSQGPDTLG